MQSKMGAIMKEAAIEELLAVPLRELTIEEFLAVSAYVQQVNAEAFRNISQHVFNLEARLRDIEDLIVEAPPEDKEVEGYV